MIAVPRSALSRRILAVVAVVATFMSLLAFAPPASAAAATAPGAPTAVTAVGFDKSAVVWFTAPASNGGAPVTSYTVTATDTTNAGRGGQTCTATDASAGCTVVGLTNADNYTFTVTATNAVGTSVASTASSAVTPAVVTAVEISNVQAGWSYCSRLSNGTVVCWGNNTAGALGDGSTTARSVPVQVKGIGGVGLLTNVASLGSGQYHRCAVLNSGGLACWGSNSSGQLGDGTTVTRLTPVRVLGADGVALGNSESTRVASVVGNGDLSSTCAVLISGKVLCWGINTYGILGDGSTTTRLKPVEVKGVGGTGTLSGVTALTSTQGSLCALQALSGVVCWGSNRYGQLGDGTTTTRLSPVQVKGVGGSGTLSGASAISGSDYGFCALVSGSVFCWGADTGTVESGLTPIQVPGVGGSGTLSGVTSLGGGLRKMCGVLNSGGVACWGYTLPPTAVTAWSGVSSLTGATYGIYCAVLVAGTVSCLTAAGTGNHQLGNGLATPTPNVAGAVIAAAPTLPTVVAKASQRATVSWTAAAGALRYTVTALDTTNNTRGGQTCTTGSTSCTLTGLTNGDNYTFKVTAYNGFLTSASASASSTTITGTPVAPTGLVASVLSATSVSVSFTAGSNGGSAITKYQYSTNAGSSWADVSSGATSSPVTITGLTTLTKYSVTLRAVNATGNGESSAAVSVTPMEQALRGVSIPGLTDNGWKAVNSVSCASEGNCSAGGYYPVSGTNTAFVVSQVDGVWQTAATVAGIPVTATESQVTSVACASAGNCSAGGYF